MATRYIHRGLSAPDAVGHANGIGFDTNDNLVVRRIIGGVQTTSIVPLGGGSAPATSTTATSAQSGQTFVASSTTSVVISLPTAAAGLTYTLVVGTAAATGAGHAFSPAATDFITGNGLTAVVNKDLICTAASDRVGDTVTIVGATGGWFITTIIGTWAKE